jgi:flagellar biosynthetic protein FliR
MLNLAISPAELELLFLVFLRTGAFLAAMPVFNAPSVPLLFRIALALAATVLLFPALKLPPPPEGGRDLIPLAAAGAGEVLLGILLGFAWRLIFEGLQLGGQLAGYQMGLAIAEVIDPASEDQVAMLSQFLNLLALGLFLILDGHHGFIRTLVSSFELVPPAGFEMTPRLLERLARLTAEVFAIGVKIGAPVIVALLLGTIAFGLVARTVAQMNIFAVSMPLNIGIGLIFFGLSLPHVAAFLSDLFGGVSRSALLLLRAMH